MESINIQINKIVEAMTIDNRGIFKRLTKLLEEHGELYEAYLSNDMNKTVEESIDNLIVLISLAYEVDKNCLNTLQLLINESYDKGIADNNIMWKSDKTHLLMAYSVTTGAVADIFQKYENVISSRYKGAATADVTLASVCVAIQSLVYFISFVSKDSTLINSLMVNKTAKWLEKVSWSYNYFIFPFMVKCFLYFHNCLLF